MSDFLDFFKNKKNLINLLLLGILVLALPLGVDLIRKQQIIKSRAIADPIVFVGDNVEQKDGKWIAKDPQISLELTSPLGPPVSQVISPSPTVPPSPSCSYKLIFGLNGPVSEKIKQLYTNPSIRFIAVGWKDFQPNPDPAYNFTSLDNQVNEAIADGQTPAVKFCDGDCFPDWARQMDQEIDRSYCCSSDYVCRVLKEDDGIVQAFKNAVQAMVARYKGKISQWDYGIEPNCRGYNPGRYTMWLKHFSEAVRAANPNAVVVGGHLSGANTDYLSAMYAQGAGQYFDRVAVDPYGQPLDYSGLENIRSIMVNQGDSDKKLWIGEWGIATNNDESRQASLIQEGLNYMASKPWIEAAFYHNYECELWANSCSPGSPGYLGFGLLRSDGTPKLAYDTFKNAVSSCGP